MWPFAHMARHSEFTEGLAGESKTRLRLLWSSPRASAARRSFQGYPKWTRLLSTALTGMHILILSYYFHQVDQLSFSFKVLFICFWRKGGRKRRRETSVCGYLSCVLYWGPGPQPRHVPWLGIEPGTLWFTGQPSVHWATPARANSSNFNLNFSFDKITWEWL